MALTKKRQRRSKEVSRDQILDKTLKLMAKVGWAGLSFQAIAKACGMSTSNIVYHFGSREEMLVELLNYVSTSNWSRVADAIDPRDNAVQRIFKHIHENLEWAAASPEKAQVLLQIYANASSDPSFAKIYSVMTERAHVRLLELVLAGRREKIIHSRLPDDLLVKLLHDWIVGAFIKISGSRLTQSFKYPVKDWEKSVSLLLELKS